MTFDLDISLAANVLIRGHGDEALTHAAITHEQSRRPAVWRTAPGGTMS